MHEHNKRPTRELSPVPLPRVVFVIIPQRYSHFQFTLIRVDGKISLKNPKVKKSSPFPTKPLKSHLNWLSVSVGDVLGMQECPVNDGCSARSLESVPAGYLHHSEGIFLFQSVTQPFSPLLPRCYFCRASHNTFADWVWNYITDPRIHHTAVL